MSDIVPTAALHAACFAAGIGEGDEVITTPLTFAASANCVLYCGAKPVFADVDRRTYNIDPEDIGRKITRRTCAKPLFRPQASACFGNVLCANPDCDDNILNISQYVLSQNLA